MYTTRSDKPIDPVVLAILGTLHAVAMRRDASYFVIGATARKFF
jgi:hypothetical protein